MALRVTIDRDDWGIPHVRGESETAAFFGVGYAQAADGLERILRHALSARGELASAFGPDWVRLDFSHRRWQHYEEARSGFARLSPTLRRDYRAYIDGVRRYMLDHPSEVPEWAPRLDPWLPVAIYRMGLWFYAIEAAMQVARNAGVKLDEFVFPVPEDTWVPGASNEWVIQPWRTSEGALMLLSDPHSDLKGAFEPFDFGIAGGRWESYGMTICGTPMPIWGHSRNVAWALTTGNPVVSDCYVVEVDPGDPARYRFDGRWQRMKSRDFEIRVKDGEPVRAKFDYTDHNGVASPVVAREGEAAYVICTPYMHVPELYDEQLYRQHLAPDALAYLEAMRTGGMWAQNVMAGDRHGNAIYLRAGRTPIRAKGVDWRKPVPGNSTRTAWRGIHPLDDLVNVVNPDAGYMQNCNVSPDVMIANPAGTPLVHGTYPDYIYNDTPGRQTTRGRRALEFLPAAFAATPEDGLSWALDETWIRTGAWTHALSDALNRYPREVAERSPLFLAVAHRLVRFDGIASADSIEALNYFFWRSAVSAGNPRSLKRLFNRVETEASLSPAESTFLLEAVETAITTMLTELGSTDLHYGDVFRVGRGGWSFPGRGGFFLARPPVGGEDRGELILAPMRLMEYRPPDERGQRWGWWGPRNLNLVIFTEPLRSYACSLWGQHDRPGSPHHSDQARLYSENRLRSTYFNLDELQAHVVSSQTLEVT